MILLVSVQFSNKCVYFRLGQTIIYNLLQLERTKDDQILFYAPT